jgi:hypothetical protein
MQMTRSAQRASLKWSVVLVLSLVFVMGADCDSDSFDGLGGVGNILSGVFDLVIGILQLVD